jgi:hypothetical protein
MNARSFWKDYLPGIGKGATLSYRPFFFELYMNFNGELLTFHICNITTFPASLLVLSLLSLCTVVCSKYLLPALVPTQVVKGVG